LSQWELESEPCILTHSEIFVAGHFGPPLAKK